MYSIEWIKNWKDSDEGIIEIYETGSSRVGGVIDYLVDQLSILNNILEKNKNEYQA